MLCADPLWLWLGPPPTVLRYVTSGFVDDVMFGRNGHKALAALSIGVPKPKQTLSTFVIIFRLKLQTITITRVM